MVRMSKDHSFLLVAAAIASSTISSSRLSSSSSICHTLPRRWCGARSGPCHKASSPLLLLVFLLHYCYFFKPRVCHHHERQHQLTLILQHYSIARFAKSATGRPTRKQIFPVVCIPPAEWTNLFAIDRLLCSVVESEFLLESIMLQ